MANEEIDKEVDEELEALPGDPKEGEEDTTDWKAEALKRDGMARRFQTKLKKLKEKPAEPKDPVEQKKPEGQPVEKKPGDLDYGQKAYLAANGIKDPKEVELVQTVIRETGKTIEQVLESKYFQSELNEMRELEQSSKAVPTGSKRAAQGAKDTVEYWIAKNELPPIDQVDLRRKVVNERYNREKNKNVFGK